MYLKQKFKNHVIKITLKIPTYNKIRVKYHGNNEILYFRPFFYQYNLEWGKI